MRHDEFNPGAVLNRILNSGLSIHDVTIEIGKVLSDQFANTLYKGVRLLLAEHCSRFQFSLYDVKRLARGVVVDGVEPKVIIVVHYGLSGLLRGDVAQRGYGESRERAGKILGFVIQGIFWLQ
jgi:hypothetical protein